MRKQFFLCLIVILLFVTSSISQSKRKSSPRKTATAYYQYSESGSGSGIIYFKVNGKVTGFTWWRESTIWRNNNSPNAHKVGAEWFIVYDPTGGNTGEPYPKLLSATFTGRVLSESNQPTGSGKLTASKYYFDITRPDCCALSSKDWQMIAAALKVSGIPTFFGIYDVLNYRENWHPVKLRRTQPNEGWLILGPFDSEASALKALYGLPKLLPNRMAGGDERRNGVETGPTNDPQTWQIGMYQINGFKTSLPVQVQRARVLQSGTLEGVIIENIGGANWAGIIVESQGVKYTVQLDGLSGGVKSQVGNVDTVGNRVRITYRDKRKENDGTYFLDVTRIVQVKK